ncbi:MAG: hypothetical protein K2H23_08050 [Oscillospiraceae bacterium]|nr:hypothetical protein [Oscillospiraceae bacterium]
MVFKQKIISANAYFTGFAEMIMVPLTGLELSITLIPTLDKIQSNDVSKPFVSTYL